MNVSEPYITVVGSPWGCSDHSKPGVHTAVAFDIGRNSFDRHAKLAGYFIGDGSLWWEAGLQSEIVHVVHILTDNIDEGIYCGYCAMNDNNYFKLLGKLKDGDDFTEQCRQILSKFKL